MRVAKNIATGVASFLARNAARLCLDRRGSIAVFLGLAIIPLVGAIGIGVDTARGFLVRSRLSQALDSAALAGGKVMFENYRDQDVAMYFASNFPNGYLGATVGTPVISDDGAKKEFLTVTAEATLPSTFMRIFGQDTITVRASATINRVNRGMELALVLDNTYSMNSNGKMASLKTAANSLLDILYGADDTANQLTVGIVPFVAMVNVGEEYSSWTTPRPTYTTQIQSIVRNSATQTGGGNTAANPYFYYACVTVVPASHPFRDGQMVDIAGTNQSYYNGRKVIRFPSAAGSWPTGCTKANNRFFYLFDNGTAAITTPATVAASPGIMTARLPPEAFAAGTGYTATNGKWKGCMDQRVDLADPNDPFDISTADTSPTAKPFHKSFNASSAGNAATGVTGIRFYDLTSSTSSSRRFRFQCNTSSSTTANTGGINDCDNNWDTGSINENGNSTNDANNRGPQKGCAVPILPLQTSKAAAKAKIATMQPWNGGGTNIPVGLAWGWRLLSPNYRGLWQSPAVATQPIDYNTPLVDKVVVLLSDGANTALEGEYPGCDGSTRNGYNCSPQDSEYTAYGRVSSGGWNGATTLTTAKDQSDLRVTAMCNAMKAKNIIIYTIMLEESEPAINQIFENCATKPEYYFQASSGNLNSVFQKIANQLSNLRLSQ